LQKSAHRWCEVDNGDLPRDGAWHASRVAEHQEGDEIECIHSTCAVEIAMSVASVAADAVANASASVK